MTHICVGSLNIIGSDDYFGAKPLPETSARLLPIILSGINLSEILVEISNISIQGNVFKNVVCKMPAIFRASVC